MCYLKHTTDALIIFYRIMLSVLSDQRCKYRAFSNMQLSSIRHRDSVANPCCRSLLWLKRSICPSALSTVWGYFRTVPDRMVLYYGLAWLKGKRPGFVSHRVHVFFGPHLATQWPSTSLLTIPLPLAIKPGCWGLQSWLTGLVTQIKLNDIHKRHFVNCSASYKVIAAPWGEDRVKPNLYPLMWLNFLVINCCTFYSFQYILYVTTIFMSSFQSFLISVRLGGKLTH